MSERRSQAGDSDRNEPNLMTVYPAYRPMDTKVLARLDAHGYRRLKLIRANPNTIKQEVNDADSTMPHNESRPSSIQEKVAWVATHTLVERIVNRELTKLKQPKYQGYYRLREESSYTDGLDAIREAIRKGAVELSGRSAEEITDEINIWSMIANTSEYEKGLKAAYENRGRLLKEDETGYTLIDDCVEKLGSNIFVERYSVYGAKMGRRLYRAVYSLIYSS